MLFLIRLITQKVSWIYFQMILFLNFLIILMVFYKILIQLGAKHVQSPFIEFGQISTVLYFLYFTVIMYGVTNIENTFVDLSRKK